MTSKLFRTPRRVPEREQFSQNGKSKLENKGPDSLTLSGPDTSIQQSSNRLYLRLYLAGTTTVVLPESPLGPCGPGEPPELMERQPLSAATVVKINVSNFMFFMEFPLL